MKTIFVLLATLSYFYSGAQNITTIAGDSTGGFSGDGGQSTSAELYGPEDVAIDAAGNIYIADFQNEVIRKVNAVTGIITTVAGNLGTGYNGDGIQATNAELNYPHGLAFDKAGNLFIADDGNQRVRKITYPGGVISTVAGNGLAGYYGDGGAANIAELNAPVSVSVDSSGNIFIADYENNVIRKVSVITGFITTIAGNSMAGYSGDGGLANMAELNLPIYIRVDNADNLYISDFVNNAVRMVNSASDVITTIAGNGFSGYTGNGGQATIAELSRPQGIALDNMGNLYFSEFGNNTVRMVNMPTGIISLVAGDNFSGYSGDGGLATLAELEAPAGLALDGSGRLVIADCFNSRIRRISSASGIEAFRNASGDLRIYPNPNGGIFTMQLIGQTQTSHLKIYNMEGEEIKNCVLTEPTTQVDLSTEPAGVYFYKALSDNGTIIGNGKILIQK